MIKLFNDKPPQIKAKDLEQNDVLFHPSGCISVVILDEGKMGCRVVVIKKDKDRSNGRVSYNAHESDRVFDVNSVWRNGRDLVAAAHEGSVELKNRENRVSLTVTGAALARRVTSKLITRSCWFETEPLPDDQWMFIAKPEGHLEAVCSEMDLVVIRSSKT
jgi:hypothetical protein